LKNRPLFETGAPPWCGWPPAARGRREGADAQPLAPGSETSQPQQQFVRHRDQSPLSRYPAAASLLRLQPKLRLPQSPSSSASVKTRTGSSARPWTANPDSQRDDNRRDRRGLCRPCERAPRCPVRRSRRVLHQPPRAICDARDTLWDSRDLNKRRRQRSWRDQPV
jgi:hypothetical protein